MMKWPPGSRRRRIKEYLPARQRCRGAGQRPDGCRHDGPNKGLPGRDGGAYRRTGDDAAVAFCCHGAMETWTRRRDCGRTIQTAGRCCRNTGSPGQDAQDGHEQARQEATHILVFDVAISGVTARLASRTPAYPRPRGIVAPLYPVAKPVRARSAGPPATL